MVASGKVEYASPIGTTEVDKVTPFSFRVHNVGEDGVFGAALQLVSGPAPATFKYDSKTVQVPVSEINAQIIYLVSPQPNCTRLDLTGEFVFAAEGNYVLRVSGVHEIETGWQQDDFVDLNVIVSPKSTPGGIVEWWNNLSTLHKATIVAAPISAVIVASAAIKTLKK